MPTTLNPLFSEAQVSQHLYSMLMEAPAAIAIVHGPQHVFTFANPLYQQVFGRSAGTLVGRSIRDVWPEVEHQGIYDLFDHIYNTGTTFKANEYAATFEVAGEQQTGYYDFIAKPMLDEFGRVSQIMIHAVDVTERAMARKKLEESEQRFRLLADSIPQLVWMTGADGKVQWQNIKNKEFFGDYYPGFDWMHFLHPDDVERTKNVWAHSVATGASYEIEYRFYDRTSKDYRWFLVQALPIRDEQGNISNWFGTCTDIHDQRTWTDQMEALVKERTNELQRSNEDLRQFAHVASHDLKEPVRKISVFGKRILNEYGDQLPQKVLQHIEKIEKATLRMQSMIDGVLQYSSINPQPEAFSSVSLCQVLHAIEDDLELLMVEKKAKLEYKDLPVVQGNATLLYQLFYNLVNNALKFSSKSQAAHIQLRWQEAPAEILQKVGLPHTSPYHLITVSDNGIGFPSHLSERIFVPFARLHTKDAYEGTGLGLSLCRKIVERHAGAMYAEGAEGQGATIYVLLPA